MGLVVGFRKPGFDKLFCTVTGMLEGAVARVVPAPRGTALAKLPRLEGICMSVKEQLDRLAAFEPAPYPVVSLYLNTQPGQTGRDQFHTFVRKEFAARGRTYPQGSPDRESLDRDFERISRFLENDVDPSANGIAIFACSAGELFEAVQVSAPIEQHWLYIGDRPHLYPLARVESLYPRYAVVLADTNSARILVLATGELVAQEEVKGVKTRKTSQGGWSQARFQRHIENFHVQHAKEVVDALDAIVQREAILEIVVAGDEVIMPLLKEQMPKHLLEKVVDELRLDTHAPLHEVVQTSLEAMQRVHGQSEREKVDAAVGGYRAGGLGVVGQEETLEALLRGQVDELLITAHVGELEPVAAQATGGANATGQTVLAEPAVATAAAGEPADVPGETVRLADELVNRATQTSARITFVKDPQLLAEYGGVAALLRFAL
jgi:peptide chain release factor subunit 1